MSSTIVFWCGVVGALAPEIVRLYSLRMKHSQFAWSWFYVIISVLFGALGGGIAIALPATTYWGAIYIGITTPVLVNKILQKNLSESDEMKSLPAPSTDRRPQKPSLRMFTKGL